MFKNTLMFAVLLTLCSLAFAQNQTQQDLIEAPTPDATTTCSVKFSSGSSTNATQFCVTVNGNIPQFSVAGREMIAVGNDMEGYGVCDVSANVGYYD